MSVWITIAVFSGMVNILNRMINLEAKKRLGVFKGTLLNYVEATALSAILVALFYHNAHIFNTAFLKEVPPVYFTGGFFGLLSLVLVMVGMSHVKVVYATVIVLLGQLGIGYIVDSIILGKLVYIKIIGIIFILIGVIYDKRIELSDKA